MIPKRDYAKDEHAGRVVTLELLDRHHTPEEVGRFLKWMHGQTAALLDDGRTGYYVEDYERWLKGLPVVD